MIAESPEQARQGLIESLKTQHRYDAEHEITVVSNDYISRSLPLLLSMEQCPHSPKPQRSGAW